MAFASHLSLYDVVLVFIMACIGFPLVRSTWLLVFMGGVSVGTCWGGGLWVVGCGWVMWES